MHLHAPSRIMSRGSTILHTSTAYLTALNVPGDLNLNLRHASDCNWSRPHLECGHGPQGVNDNVPHDDYIGGVHPKHR
jgi:hypothetical protein